MAGPQPWGAGKGWAPGPGCAGRALGLGAYRRGLCQDLGSLTCVLLVVRFEAWLISESRNKELLCCQKAKKWGL